MKILFVALVTVLALSSEGFTGDDPTIKGKIRQEIQKAMKDHIAESLVDSVYAIYDGQEGALLRLKLGALHSGIVKKAEFYVSCADFTDTSGREYDLDFLVGDTGGGLRVLEGVVHKVDGVKRPYDLEETSK